MRLLLIVFFVSTSLFAQYTIKDYNLVKTTFTRDFDRSIITPYLSSDNEQKVNAALLSISNSSDTAFISEIIKLDFSKFGEKIAYTLGQLPRTENSIDFLFSNLSDKNNYHVNKQIFAAIGKTGQITDLEKLLNDKSYYLDGKSIALAHFAMRRVRPETDNFSQVIFDEVKSTTGDIFEDNLWALLRAGGDSTQVEYLKSLILDSGKYNSQSRIYALQILNRVKISLFTIDELTQVLADNDWRIRNESVKLIKYTSGKDDDFIKLFNICINDENPNVSREFSRNIIGTSFNENAKISSFIKEQLKREDLTENTVGELFTTYCALFPDLFKISIETYKNIVPMQYIIGAVSTDTSNSDYKLEFLESITDYNNSLIISPYTNSLLSLQNKFYNNYKYKKLIFDLFSSNSVVGVGILSYDLDSVFIAANKEELKKNLKETITRNLDNYGFSESLVSLTNISAKVDSSFNNVILEILKNSKIPSVSNFAKNELGTKIDEKDANLELFEEIWAKAFTYKSTRIKTEKGEFEFKFTPEYCPLSVGNFVKLSEENYFNGVIFHRIVPNFVAQTGDSTSTGWGGPGYEIISEFSDKPFVTGAVGMASAGKDTEGSQWYVMHSRAQHLDGRYSNFGNISDGQKVVDILDQGDRIISITLKN